MTNPSSMHKTGHSKPMHWENPVEWDGEEGGRGVWNGEHMYTHSWFMSMYGKKKHHNIIKYLAFNYNTEIN